MIRAASASSRGTGTSQDDLAAARPLTGSPEEIAAGIRAFGAQGVSHLQIYPIPPTLATIEALVPILEAVRRSVPDEDEGR